MRICFFASDKPREHLLADAVLRGAAKHGHKTEVRELAEDVDVTGCDVACMVGVKSRVLLSRINRTGAHWMMFDKGYCRGKGKSPVKGWEYWRVSIDSHHPTSRLYAQRSGTERLDRLGLSLKPWREHGWPVLLAGSSAKYHEFYGILEPTRYAQSIVSAVRSMGKRPIIYRPKPSWAGAVPITKAAFSRPPETISQALTGAHCMVTHGSNACFEAVLAGIPCIVLGDAVAKPISSTVLGEIENPRMVGDAERWQWLSNLAYWQWTLAEFASGEAWDFLGEQIHG